MFKGSRWLTSEQRGSGRFTNHRALHNFLCPIEHAENHAIERPRIIRVAMALSMVYGKGEP